MPSGRKSEPLDDFILVINGKIKEIPTVTKTEIYKHDDNNVFRIQVHATNRESPLVLIVSNSKEGGKYCYTKLEVK